ncbi:MAG: DUF4445 domain-containing protein [Peptostreptococcaceae bacterium]|nr:DUF4445 domain-containing protein [Peptostreptococcaceae bacterium]
MKITFMPQNVTEAAMENETILEVASRIGVSIDGNCAGAGTCGKCKVKISKGSVEQINEHKCAITETEISNNYRLACCCKPLTDIEVFVPETKNINSRKEKLFKIPKDFSFDLNLTKETIKLEKSTLKNQLDDESKIRKILGYSELFFRRQALIKLPEIISRNEEFTLTIIDDYVIDVEDGDTGKDNYGIAIDIGTTTVVLMLWDLYKEEIIGIKAVTNPQGVYGADVISRIDFTNSEEHRHLLHDVLINKINEMIYEFENLHNIKRENIYKIVACGNTTMSHLFWDVAPTQLAVSPFTPVFCDYKVTNAKDLGIAINNYGTVELLPNIAGHVGSDITAGIVTTDIMKKDKGHLFIDIGTNGEIVLSGKNKAYTCSTAAGPAFEGSSILQGMRAANGAIEKVYINSDGVQIKTIGEEKPIGICGSGIIDAVGQMISSGVVDKKGKILDRIKLEKNEVPEAVIERVEPGDKGNQFVLYSDDSNAKVVITQKDVREVQLAKAAIAAGIETMMEEANISLEELERISVAGAFGSHINMENSINLGLLPNVPLDKIHNIGNSAGIGASMALLSKKSMNDIIESAKEIEHIELSARRDFQDKYIKAMMF